MLEEAGFTVDTAENGKLAVDKVRENAPGYYDLVLMDIQMPVMNGYEGHARHPRPAGRRKGGPAHRRHDGERL